MKNISFVFILLIYLIFLSESSVFIIDENGRSLSDIIGPLNEGSRLSLLCETNGEPSEKSISLDLNLKPLNVHITSLQRPLSADRRTTLKCQSSGSRPPAVLTWWIGSRQLLNATVATYDSTTISKLTLVPTSDDHGRVLSCRATNPVMNGHILEDHRVLNIHHIPALSVTVGTPNVFILEGDVVYFDCNIIANPPATEVGWRFNNEPVYTNINAGIKIQNRSLLLHKITRKYAGNYSCVAANSEGEGFSESVAIDVHFVPFCASNQRASYGVPLRESVNIECKVEANPPNVAFHWYLNNTYRQILFEELQRKWHSQYFAVHSKERERLWPHNVCG
ncbi:uncharacterized protein CEXT_123301 [Caerostris extrusa]|uniref:Ig-like domain-containing protein n=1 Tax=Caerostris extrusa TaxID=172846 RepID=A0AAV4X6N0_CAEEX|nr:uncharacterized protein CEXT_123301 [Caerostris extrusa]